jgi:ribonucleoside-diphosphate reductase alpha chain
MTLTLTKNQYDIFYDRYALRDDAGARIEHDPEQMWRRVARAIADNAGEEAEYYDILSDFHFVPGGRILSGAGAEKGKTFYNCYVIPVETSARRSNRKLANLYSFARFDDEGATIEEYEFRDPSLQEDHGNDSRESIMDTIGTMVGIMSRGGGVGINWSVLRPRKSYLQRVSGSTSGPVSWMDVASRAVGVVEQGGSRRGAAMFMLDDWHPDVLEFIDAKKTKGVITNANISVAVSDRFMESVKSGGKWTFLFPDTRHPDYDTLWDGDIVSWQDAGRPVVAHQTIDARTLWDALVSAAHASGEPGVVFLDRYNDLSTANGVERIICVNPCGEQGLGAYSVCNLGAMNLDAYIVGRDFLWGKFGRDVSVAIRFLDAVIDKDKYYVDETREQQTSLRRTGLGVMGLADALIRMGIRYGSPTAIRFTEDIFRTMKDEAIETSVRLAFEKGTAKGWKSWMWDRPYLKEYLGRKGWPSLADSGMRNLFLLTQAPTGTTSLLAGVNSGIEPYFDIVTHRSDRTGDRTVYAKAVEDLDIPEGVSFPDFVVTSKDVTVEEHIAMQAAVQKYVDSSVSKTVNAPNEQTVEECAKAYMLAYDSGLKGLAYYRDGSRSIQVLYHEDPNEIIARQAQEIETLRAKLASPWRNNLSLSDQVITTENLNQNLCPDCSVGIVVIEEGCKMCHSCGWSAC